jgi:hypothetical protein
VTISREDSLPSTPSNLWITESKLVCSFSII